jgi:hypothetical protein
MMREVAAGTLQFDSNFEGGNLDVVVRTKEDEYDLYIRADSNARGHNQWFYFSAVNTAIGTVRFNILNFSKRDSFYAQGMRVAILSSRKAERASKGELPPLYKGWHRGGDNIVYKNSKLSQDLLQKAHIVYALETIV